MDPVAMIQDPNMMMAIVALLAATAGAALRPYLPFTGNANLNPLDPDAGLAEKLSVGYTVVEVDDAFKLTAKGKAALNVLDALEDGLNVEVPPAPTIPSEPAEETVAPDMTTSEE